MGHHGYCHLCVDLTLGRTHSKASGDITAIATSVLTLLWVEPTARHRGTVGSTQSKVNTEVAIAVMSHDALLWVLPKVTSTQVAIAVMSHDALLWVLPKVTSTQRWQ